MVDKNKFIEEMYELKRCIDDSFSERGIDMALIKNQEDLDRLNDEGLMPDGTRVIPENDIGKYGFVKLFDSNYEDNKDHIDNYAYNDTNISNTTEIGPVSFPILKFWE